MTDGEGGLVQPVEASDDIAADLDERQVTLGEGPASDVIAGHQAVRIPDLATAGPAQRWPMFASYAQGGSVRACFAIPLRAGVVELGVLTVYRTRPGYLSSAELSLTHSPMPTPRSPSRWSATSSYRCTG